MGLVMMNHGSAYTIDDAVSNGSQKRSHSKHKNTEFLLTSAKKDMMSQHLKQPQSSNIKKKSTNKAKKPTTT